MVYHGVIIEESLEDPSVLNMVKIVETNVEPVTEKHHTPWLKQWTLHTVEVSEDRAPGVAEKISQTLEREHPWYADFKNAETHYIIFRDKVFRVNRRNAEEYEAAKHYGMSLGIPEYQLDFSSEVVVE